MKAQLTFDLSEDQHPFDCAINGTKYYDLIFEFKEKLRQIEKYEDLDDKQVELIGRIRDYLNEEMMIAGIADQF
jgi:hypothetical protein